MAAAHESQSAAWTSTSASGMAQFQHEDCTFDVWQLNLIHDGDTQQTLNLLKGHIVWKIALGILFMTSKSVNHSTQIPHWD